MVKGSATTEKKATGRNARQCFATLESTGETLFLCPECGEMDGRITGVDLMWGKEVAYTMGDKVRLAKRADSGTSHVLMQVVCNGCGAEHEVRFGEMIPDGMLALERGEHRDDQ